MKALVFIEYKDASPIGASLELVSAAAELGAEATAVCVAEKEGYLLEDLVAAALTEKGKDYDVILLAATTLGKLVTPRVAARLGGGSVNDAIALSADGGQVVAIRPVYGGSAQESIRVLASPAVISVRGGSFAAPESAPAIEALEASTDGIQTKIVEVIAEEGETVNLEDASIIVSGGRGMGTEEDFALCKEMADILGGVVGATRPAIESGWINRMHQVGQSGKIVNPDLYIACGVSGAMQHLSGMIGSKYIVAINKDEDAAIFSVADVGIVGDVKTIMPLMTEEFKKRKS